MTKPVEHLILYDSVRWWDKKRVGGLNYSDFNRILHVAKSNDRTLVGIVPLDDSSLIAVREVLDGLEERKTLKELEKRADAEEHF